MPPFRYQAMTIGNRWRALLSHDFSWSTGVRDDRPLGSYADGRQGRYELKAGRSEPSYSHLSFCAIYCFTRGCALA